MRIFALTVALLVISCFSKTAFAQDSVKTAIIKVGNLHCNGDMPTIKKQLLNQDGVEEVAFTERSGTSAVFTITFHSAATSEQQIEKAIESTPGCDDKTETPYRVKKEPARKQKKS